MSGATSFGSTLRRCARLLSDVGAFARSQLRPATRAPGAVVLAYHDISSHAPTDHWTVSVDEFRRQLQQVRRLGLTFASLETISNRIASGEALDGLVAVTFDDVPSGVVRHGLPVLRELGVPATAFIVAGQLGASPAWYPDIERIITEAELGEMVDAGLTIGSHTMTHPSLPSLSITGIDEEVGRSRELLHALTGQSVDLLAYPFGHYDSTVRQRCEVAGYRAAVSFFNGRVDRGSDLFCLRRITMWRGTTSARFALQLFRSTRNWVTAHDDRPNEPHSP